MVEKDASPTEYRGYSLIVTDRSPGGDRSPGWCVHIFPGHHGLRHAHPDHVLGSTKEEALSKARATVATMHGRHDCEAFPRQRMIDDMTARHFG